MAFNSSDAKKLQTKKEEKQEELINPSESLVEDIVLSSRARQLARIRLFQQQFAEGLDEAELGEEAITEDGFIAAFMESSCYNQHFTCPISKEPMRDPVSLEETGISYERHALAATLLHEPNPLCSLTRKPLPQGKNVSSMATNMALKNLISEAIQTFKNSPEGQKYKDIKYEPMVMVEESASHQVDNYKELAKLVSMMGSTFPAGITAKILASHANGCSCGACVKVTGGAAIAGGASAALCMLSFFAGRALYQQCTASSSVQNGDPVAVVMEEESAPLNLQQPSLGYGSNGV